MRQPALTHVFGFSRDPERVACYVLARDPDGRLFGVRQWR